MFNGLLSPIKKINRLISKGMSKNYLKVAIKENWRSQNFDFPCLQNSSPNLFLLQLFCCNLKKTGLGGKVCFFIITFLILKGIITF